LTVFLEVFNTLLHRELNQSTAQTVLTENSATIKPEKLEMAQSRKIDRFVIDPYGGLNVGLIESRR